MYPKGVSISYVCIYIYIYTYIHTYTDMHVFFPSFLPSFLPSCLLALFPSLPSCSLVRLPCCSNQKAQNSSPRNTSQKITMPFIFRHALPHPGPTLEPSGKPRIADTKAALVNHCRRLLEDTRGAHQQTQIQLAPDDEFPKPRSHIQNSRCAFPTARQPTWVGSFMFTPSQRPILHMDPGLLDLTLVVGCFRGPAFCEARTLQAADMRAGDSGMLGL